MSQHSVCVCSGLWARGFLVSVYNSVSTGVKQALQVLSPSPPPMISPVLRRTAENDVELNAIVCLPPSIP